MVGTVRRKKERRNTLPQLRALNYKNKKHKYKLSESQQKRRRALDAGIRAERKTKKSIKKAATAKKARLNVLRIYRKNTKPKECNILTQDMKYIDKKYGLGKTKNICKKTKKRISGKTRKRWRIKQRGGGGSAAEWATRVETSRMRSLAALAETKDPGITLTLSGDQSTDEQRPDSFLRTRPYEGPIDYKRSRKLHIRIPSSEIQYFFTRLKDNKWTADMTRTERDEFNKTGISIKKNLSKSYGCEQLDIILETINDMISSRVDRSRSVNKAVIEHYKNEGGMSEEEITEKIEDSVLKGFKKYGMRIPVGDKRDDGGGIYIPSLNICISGHEIREIYAPHLAKGQKVREELEGMKVNALKKRAKEIGVDERKLEGVAAGRRKDTIIALILEQMDHPPKDTSEDIWRAVKGILQANASVEEEVRNIETLELELNKRGFPLPPRPNESQEEIRLYEKLIQPSGNDYSF